MANRLRKRTVRNDFEEEVRNGLDNSLSGEINIIQTVNKSNRSSVFPFHQKRIKLFEYEFLKTYLYAVYSCILQNSILSVDNYNALASSSNPVIVAPDIVGTDDNGLAIVENQSVFVNLKYKNATYQVTVFVSATQDGPYNILRYFISILGADIASNNTIDLAEFLIKESVRNSYYKNKILTVYCDDEDRIDISQVPKERFHDEILDNIFIPENVKDELERFHLCVENYANLRLGLRYLFCGEPGTGKTKSVRTLINMCKEKATIIIAEGKIDFQALFDFASMFEPAIICIDDLDLLIGSRESGFSPNTLGALLQELDGFEKNNIFLLATTNDKYLIDKAASRPGRFDMVIDYNILKKDNYEDLIDSFCKTSIIIDLFDEHIINTLRKNKITGAYLVNLIKQLEIKYKLEPTCDLIEYINNLINLTYRGFYKKTDEKEQTIGFGNYDGNGIEEKF